jgi:hypothetical protein
MIFAADQATGIVACDYVTEPNVMRQAAEERYPLSNEYWHTRDDEALDEACAEKLLNRDAAVNIEMPGTGGGELRDDSIRRAGHLFDKICTGCGQFKWTATQDHDAPVPIRPGPKRENRLEGVAAHHNYVDGCYEFFITMILTAVGWQKIQGSVRARDETVQAGADKN